MCYELATEYLNREFVAKILNSSKQQEVTTDYKIQFRTSHTDYVSATNPKIYKFVAIRGSSGRSVRIPPIREKISRIVKNSHEFPFIRA